MFSCICEMQLSLHYFILNALPKTYELGTLNSREHATPKES